MLSTVGAGSVCVWPTKNSDPLMNVNAREVVAITTLVIFFIDVPLQNALHTCRYPLERQGAVRSSWAPPAYEGRGSLQWTEHYFGLTSEAVDEKRLRQ